MVDQKEKQNIKHILGHLKTIISPFLMSVPPTSQQSSLLCHTQKLAMSVPLTLYLLESRSRRPLLISPWVPSFGPLVSTPAFSRTTSVSTRRSQLGQVVPLAEDAGVDVEAAVDSMLTMIVHEDQPGNVGV